MQNKLDKTSESAKNLYRMTDERHTFFSGYEKPDATMNTAARNAMDNSRQVFYSSFPSLTYEGIQLLFSGRDNALGLSLTIGGIFVDLFKFPVCLTVGLEELIRAGVCKLTSAVLEGSPEDEERKRIFSSFEQRFKDIASFLVQCDFETAQSIKDKINEEGIGELVGLSLFLTAYDSRHCSSNEIMLASGKILPRYNCPKEGIPLFNKLTELTYLIQKALSFAPLRDLSDEKRNHCEAKITLTWIPMIRKGTIITQEDAPEVQPEVISLVNHMIEIIASFKYPSDLLSKDKEEELSSYIPRH